MSDNLSATPSEGSGGNFVKKEVIQLAVKEIKRSLNRKRVVRIKLLRQVGVLFYKISKKLEEDAQIQRNVFELLEDFDELIVESAKLCISVSLSQNCVTEIYDLVYDLGTYIEIISTGVYSFCKSNGEVFGNVICDMLDSLLAVCCEHPESWLHSVMISRIVLNILNAFFDEDHENFRKQWIIRIKKFIKPLAKAVYSCGDFHCQHFLMTVIQIWVQWTPGSSVIPTINSAFSYVEGSERKELFDTNAHVVRNFLNAMNTSPRGPKSIIPIQCMYLFMGNTQLNPPAYPVNSDNGNWVDFSIGSGRLHCFHSSEDGTCDSINIRRDQIDSVCLNWIVNEVRSQDLAKVFFFHVILHESSDSYVPSPGHRTFYFVFRNGELVEKIMKDMGYPQHKCGTRNCKWPKALRSLLALHHSLSYSQAWCPQSQVYGLDKTSECESGWNTSSTSCFSSQNTTMSAFTMNDTSSNLEEPLPKRLRARFKKFHPPSPPRYNDENLNIRREKVHRVLDEYNVSWCQDSTRITRYLHDQNEDDIGEQAVSFVRNSSPKSQYSSLPSFEISAIGSPPKDVLNLTQREKEFQSRSKSASPLNNTKVYKTRQLQHDVNPIDSSPTNSLNATVLEEEDGQEVEVREHTSVDATPDSNNSLSEEDIRSPSKNVQNLSLQENKIQSRNMSLSPIGSPNVSKTRQAQLNVSPIGSPPTDWLNTTIPGDEEEKNDEASEYNIIPATPDSNNNSLSEGEMSPIVKRPEDLKNVTNQGEKIQSRNKSVSPLSNPIVSKARQPTGSPPTCLLNTTVLEGEKEKDDEVCEHNSVHATQDSNNSLCEEEMSAIRSPPKNVQNLTPQGKKIQSWNMTLSPLSSPNVSNTRQIQPIVSPISSPPRDWLNTTIPEDDEGKDFEADEYNIIPATPDSNNNSLSEGEMSPIFGFSKTLVREENGANSLHGDGNKVVSSNTRSSESKLLPVPPKKSLLIEASPFNKVKTKLTFTGSRNDAKSTCYANAFKDSINKLLQHRRDPNYDHYNLLTCSDDDFKNKLFPKIKTYSRKRKPTLVEHRRNARKQRLKLATLEKRNVLNIIMKPGAKKTPPPSKPKEIPGQLAVLNCLPQKYTTIFSKRD